MAGLAGDLDDGVALEDQQRHPGRAQVVRSRRVEPDVLGGRLVAAPAPVAVVDLAHRVAVQAREERAAGPAGGARPVDEVLFERVVEADVAVVARLRVRVDRAVDVLARDGDRPFTEVLEAQRECLLRAQSGEGEDGKQRLVARLEPVAHALERQHRESAHALAGAIARACGSAAPGW